MSRLTDCASNLFDLFKFSNILFYVNQVWLQNSCEIFANQIFSLNLDLMLMLVLVLVPVLVLVVALVGTPGCSSF